MIEIFDFYKKMQDHRILLSFKGEVTEDLLSSILNIMENKLEQINEEPKIRKKLFNVLVECLQNLYHHVDDIEKTENVFQQSKSSIVVVGIEDNDYFITTGNLIQNSKVGDLQSRLDRINSLNKEELKLYYQDVLSNEGFSEKGGGGLGMIDIARKSGQKINYDFKNISDQNSFFTLHIKVSPNNN